MLPPVDRWRAMRFDAIPAPARPVLRCTPSSKAACCLPPARRHLRLGRERLLLLWGAARDHLDRVCLRERLQREAPTTRAPRMQSRPTAQADGAGRRNRPTAQADGTGRRNRLTEQADGAGRAGPGRACLSMRLFALYTRPNEPAPSSSSDVYLPSRMLWALLVVPVVLASTGSTS